MGRLRRFGRGPSPGRRIEGLDYIGVVPSATREARRRLGLGVVHPGLALVIATLGLLVPGTSFAQEAAPPGSQAPHVGRRARAERMLATGRAMAAAGTPGMALSHFRRALDVDPGLVEAYAAMADVYLERGSIRSAIEVTTVGLTRHPHHALLAVRLAAALEAAGDARRAADVLRDAVRHHPSDPAVVRAYAEHAKRQGAFTEALAAYRRLLDLDARGETVDRTVLEEARRMEAGLARLALTVDPCATARPVTRALGECAPAPPAADGPANEAHHREGRARGESVE